MVGVRGVGENRAASPVIAAVLLVAVTVLLASAAGYVVFGMADQTKETAPQTAVTSTYDRNAAHGDAVELEFVSGDALEAKNVRFDLHGAVAVDTSGTDRPTELSSRPTRNQIGAKTSAGDTVRTAHSTVNYPFSSGEQLDLSGATLRLVWDPASADIQESETIWRWSPQ